MRLTHLKPLFNARLLREACTHFEPQLTESQRTISADWAKGTTDAILRGKTEKSLQGVFLAQIFDQLLGYKQVVGAEDWHYLQAETSASEVKSSKTPDGRLGWFRADIAHTRAVIELKAPYADLDAKQGKNYGNLTAIEQAFGYANKLDGCRWVIVSNFTTIRLYRTERGQGYCHVFETAQLANPEKLKELLYLLGQATLLGPTPGENSQIDQLASETHVEEERISKAFYAFYKGVRSRLFQQLVGNNPLLEVDTEKTHEIRLLEYTQKILDRVLFICFCEDTGLLPPDTIRKALTATQAGFIQVTRWQQMVGLFSAVDHGHPQLKINGYNGGLFAKDAGLDELKVTDEALEDVLTLATYDFETDLNVNILGHIFEQSISDLEALRAEIRGETVERGKSKRKQEGIFYTPEFITRFIVSRTVGGWLAERWKELELQHKSDKPGPMSKANRVKLLHGYLERLASIKIVDPACGSGAFLVAVFDFLHAEYERVNLALAELTGQPSQMGLFDLDRQILQENLFGVDLNPESVEITKLSLWLKTARSDKPLNNLDGNIRCGNSLISPPSQESSQESLAIFNALPDGVHPFDWHVAFPEIFTNGGFDVVLGNPPYVRQETISPTKSYLAQHYASYNGVADLYIYFYERGFNLLNERGKLSYIVSNKWLRAGYGEPLRHFFSNQAVFEEIIDFGHAPIFENADTFPCIIVAHRQDHPRLDAAVHVCPVSRDRPTELSLEQYVEEHSYEVPWSRYGKGAWSLERPEVNDLMAKINSRGAPLVEFAASKPKYGIKTGLNAAFFIDVETRTRLIKEDATCSDMIKPLLRGQDVTRWTPDWKDMWIIEMKSSGDHRWPWTDSGDRSEQIFAETYPSLYRHFKGLELKLRKRRDQGQHWWELRSCDYYHEFYKPKIVYQVIQFHPQYALDSLGRFGNDKTFFIPTVTSSPRLGRPA